MKKKEFVIYVVVGVMFFFIFYNYFDSKFEPAKANQGETEWLELCREYEEDTNPTLTWRSISNQSESIEYEENVKEWLRERNED